MATGDRSAKWALLTDEVLLADELVERAWSHPSGQWLAILGRLEERFGANACQSSGRPAGGHVRESKRTRS